MSASASTRLVALLVTALMVVVATAAGAETRWAEFKPRQMAFTIDMPGEWTLAERKTSRPGDDQVQLHMASVKVNGRAYMTVYWSVPGDKVAALSTTQLLDAARAGILSSGKDKLRSEKRVTIGEFPAREIIVDSSDSKVYVMRYLAMKNVMIQAVVAGPPGVEQELDTTRFLTSLKHIGS